MKNSFNQQCILYSQMNMISNARIFWRRFTTWIRVYIISRYIGIGTAEEAFGRLYVETAGFGDILQIVYDRESSNQLSLLLNQLTFALRDLISAQLQGNSNAVEQNVNRLYQAADNLAVFLSSVNPYLNEEEWRNMLRSYVQYTIEEANLFITGNYSQDIELFERLTDLSNRMGDSFAQGFYNFITGGEQNSVDISPQEQGCITYEQMNQIYNMRMFWFEFVTWTRAYMLSRYNNIGNENAVKARLQQVPVEYVETLQQFFGEAIDPNLQELYNYINLIDALITAQIEGNTEEINRTTQLLYENADRRAKFISSVNPYWDENEWKRRLYANLRSTIDQSTSFLTENYALNLDIFSTLLNQAESTSNYFARGLFNYIIAQ